MPGFSFLDIVLRPRLTFFYNYILRGGFLDGREGLLLHLYHAEYVSWKYAKAWEAESQSARGKVLTRCCFAPGQTWSVGQGPDAPC